MNSLIMYNKGKYFLFIVPGLIVYLYIYGWSMVTGLFYSFTDWNGFGKSYSIVGFKNYLRLLKTPRFFDSILFTVKYTFLLAVISNGAGLVLALMLNRSMKGKIFFRAMYFLPAVLSMVTAGLIWNEIFYRVFPVIGKIIGSEILSKSILGNMDIAIFGVLWVHVWQYTAQPFVLFLAGLQAIPSDVLEAAKIDGADYLQTFKYISIPFLMPIIQITMVLSIKYGFTVFDYILAMTDGGPGGATTSISVLIYKLGFAETRFAYGCAMAVVTFILIVVLSSFQLRLTRDREGIQ